MADKLKEYLRAWETSFSHDPQLQLVHGTIEELKREGVSFPDPAAGRGGAGAGAGASSAAASAPAPASSSGVLHG